MPRFQLNLEESGAAGNQYSALLLLTFKRISTVHYSPLKATSYPLLSETLNMLCTMVWQLCIQIPHIVNHSKQFEHELDMTGINYPVQLSDMQKFERTKQFFSECFMDLKKVKYFLFMSLESEDLFDMPIYYYQHDQLPKKRECHKQL